MLFGYVFPGTVRAVAFCNSIGANSQYATGHAVGLLPHTKDHEIMNKYYLLPLLFLPMGRIAAQPVLTSATNAPSAVDSYTRRYATYLPPGAGGANVVWDLRDLEYSEAETVQFVPAISTPDGAAFPTATLAMVTNDVTTYLKTQTSGIHVVGTVADGTVISLSDDERQLQFPCTMGTSWADMFSGNYMQDEEVWTRVGTIEASADGYGTIRLPSGDVTDVLRIHSIETVTDATGDFSLTSTVESYQYFAVGTAWPLVQLFRETIEIFGEPIVLEFAVWSDPLTTGVEDDALGSLALSAFPNPAQNEITVTLPSDEEHEIEIFDLHGGMVQQGVALGGTTQCHFDLAEIASGSYVVTARDRTGRKGSVRIVVR